MITNLLSNALKFTPPGGEVEVTLHGETIWSNWSWRTPAAASRPSICRIFSIVFTACQRADGTQREPGLGLGLSFVAWIVKAHDGRVDVHSELRQGHAIHDLIPGCPTQPPSLGCTVRTSLYTALAASS